MPTWVCSYGTLVEAAPSLADCTYILSVSLSDDFSRCFALLLVVGCAPLIARVFLPSSQRPLWQWRVVFMSRLGVTALDGLAKTKESDKVWYCLLLLMFLSSLLLLLLVAFFMLVLPVMFLPLLHSALLAATLVVVVAAADSRVTKNKNGLNVMRTRKPRSVPPTTNTCLPSRSLLPPYFCPS